MQLIELQLSLSMKDLETRGKSLNPKSDPTAALHVVVLRKATGSNIKLSMLLYDRVFVQKSLS